MKKTLKRLGRRVFAFALALVLGLGVIPEMTAQAAETSVKTDNVITTAYSKFNPNTTLSNTVSGGFAENGYGTVVLDDEHPTATDVAFCHYWGSHIAGWPNGFQMIAVEKNTNPSVATATARSTENGLVVDFKKGTGTGKTTIVIGFTVTTLRTTANIASSGQTYAGFSGYLYYTVSNNGNGSTTVTPNPGGEKPSKKPDASDIDVYMFCDSYTKGNTHFGRAGYLSQHTDKWSLGEVVPCDWMDGYEWFCPLNMDMDQWTTFYKGVYGNKHMFSMFGHGYDRNDALDNPISAPELGFYWDGSSWQFYEGYLFIVMTEYSSQIDYTVVHEYYTNGEFDGKISETVKTGKTGNKIYGDNIAKKLEYNSNTYTYTSATPNPLTLSDDKGYNVITLKYEINDVVEKNYTVIYKDGANGTAFGDEGHGNLSEGDKTPAFEGSTERDGYTFQGWTPAVKDTVAPDMANENGEIIYTATWLKDEVVVNTYSIRVIKNRTSESEVKGEGTVDYKVNVTNTSTASLYDLVIDDTMDAGLTLVNPENVSATIAGESVELKYLGKETKENGKTVYSWEMPGEFVKDATVVLTYSATVSNEGSEDITLRNVAHGKAYTTAAENAISLVSDDRESVSDSESTSTTVESGRGYVEDWSNQDVTGGNKPGENETVVVVRPKTYKVTYSWNGLPESAAEKLPEEKSYVKDTEVTVDGTHHNGMEITVGTETYVFSGWSSNDVSTEAGKFNMPAENVTITGTWTVKKTEPEEPQKPTPQEVNRLVRGESDSAVYVYCAPGRHKVGYFDCYNVTEDGSAIHTDRIVIGDVIGENGNYTCTVTFLAQKFADAYSSLKRAEHVLVAGENNKEITLNWNAETGWVLNADAATPIVFNVKCKTITAIWKNGVNNEVIQGPREYLKGTSIDDIRKEDPEVPVVEGKEFVEWTVEIDDEGNVTITANYKDKEENPVYPVDPNGPALEEIKALISVMVQDERVENGHGSEKYDVVDGSYGTEVTKNDDGTYNCVVTIAPNLYVDRYNDSHGLHTSTNGEQKVTLVYMPKPEEPETEAVMTEETDTSDSDIEEEDLVEKEITTQEDEDEEENVTQETEEADAGEAEEQNPEEDDVEVAKDEAETSDEGTDPINVSEDEKDEDASGDTLVETAEEGSVYGWILAEGESNLVTFTVICEDTAPVDPTPVDPTPVDPTPVDPTPVDPTPVEPTPVDPSTPNPTPVDPAPEEPAPAPVVPVIPAVTPVEPTVVPPTVPEGEPEVEIEEEENPLAAPVQQPEEEEVVIPAAEMEIEDEELPLASGSGRSWALVNFALMNLAVFETLMLLIGYFVNTKKEEEEEEEKKLKKKGIVRLTSLPVAVISIIVFCLTEDITLPTGFVDRWTIWMAVIAVAQTVLVVLSRKKEEDELEKVRA